MRFRTIAVVGLGLMGGSLAAACRRKFPSSRIVGISRNKHALALALKRKWIHQGTSELAAGLKDADFIILCTPVDTLNKILELCDRFAPAGARVTDVGSVKKVILRQAEKRKWKRIEFVGAHPMVGSHEKGIEAAQPHLYDEGYTFLIKNGKVSPQSYAAAKHFWEKISKRVVEVTASEHDQIVSEISHLPHIAAVCLMLSVQKRSLLFAASGFRDVTRIAQGNPLIWLPILQTNKRQIAVALKRFEREVKNFQRAIRSGNDPQLRQLLLTAGKRRQQI